MRRTLSFLPKPVARFYAKAFPETKSKYASRSFRQTNHRLGASRRWKISVRDYLAAVLPGLADRRIQRLPDLPPRSVGSSACALGKTAATRVRKTSDTLTKHLNPDFARQNAPNASAFETELHYDVPVRILGDVECLASGPKCQISTSKLSGSLPSGSPGKANLRHGRLPVRWCYQEGL